MRIEVYAAPGEGASDALLDWLEAREVVADIHDVRSDEGRLAEAISIGGLQFPLVRIGETLVRGFDPASLLQVLGGDESAVGGVTVTADPDRRAVVAGVRAGTSGHLAGLHAGDVVEELAGYTNFSLDQLRSRLADGRPVTLGVRRGERRLKITISEQRLAA